MNFWTFKMTWMLVAFCLWFKTFTPSEKVALGSAFLVLIGVIGEEVAELKFLEGKRRERIKRSVKRFAISILVLGLAGDLGSVVAGQAEMAALTKEAGDAKQSATGAANALKDANTRLSAIDVRTRALDTRLNAAGQNMTQVQRSVTASTKELTEFEAKIAWRTVSPAQLEILKQELQKVHGRQIMVTWETADPEQAFFGPQLSDALRKAGLSVISMRSPLSSAAENNPAPISFRQATQQNLDLVKSVADALSDASLAALPMPTSHPGNVIINGNSLILAVGPRAPILGNSNSNAKP